MIESLYEPFKHWAEHGSIWLISDPHFDDEDTKAMDPNWISPEDYIKELNSKIYKNDTLVCLGDCGNLERFNYIKCKNKVLIKGNHDDLPKYLYHQYFSEVYDGPLFITPKILLSHEPVYGLPFCLNIHGHCHGGIYAYVDEFECKHLNIAADVIQFQPVNLAKLIKAGAISDIPTIHRITIDKATENPIHKK